MKVLVISNGYPNAKGLLSGIFARDQALALKEQGFDIMICALDMRSIRRRRKLGMKRFVDKGIAVIQYDVPVGRVGFRLLNVITWLAFKRAYKKIVKDWGKPDAIHAHFGRSCGYVAFKAKQKYGIEYVITEHDSGVMNEEFSNAEKKLLQKIYDGAMDRIAVSRCFQKKLQELFALPFRYIPNIVDVDSFSNVCKVPHEGVNAVSVGTLNGTGKGMDIAIKAFAIAKKKNANLGTLTIIGGGSNMNELKTVAVGEGIADSVIFTGQLPREEIANHFAASDMFVLASRGETFGVVYIEAMCAGLPVIATRCGGPEGIFTENEGKLVQVDHVGELSDAMLELSEKLSEYDPDKIREFCVEHYSPSAVGKQLSKVMQKEILR